MPIYANILDLVGRTPLLDLSGLVRSKNLNARILGKLESFNPGHSVKDRAALGMIRAAERDGLLKAGGTIVEPTSGNTGIGLALVARRLGYKAVLTMPDSMSVERRQTLKAFGAELVLTPGAQGMKGAIAKAEELVREIPGAYMPMQFKNPANAQAHYESTGPEIWQDTEGGVDVFVAGVGTGGTVSGTGRYLKERNGAVRIVAVEPTTSPVLSGGAAGPHKIQGIGAGFVPELYDASVVDEVLPVANEDAFAAARLVSKTDGVLVGISSGAALAAAVALAERPELQGKTIVVLLPDTGERYLSTPLFADN
ncbi:MAG: cysteine synthase A [Duodenibacillus sp.]|nr:cysteine synthase A [Duodenibacillus sp.]